MDSDIKDTAKTKEKKENPIKKYIKAFKGMGFLLKYYTMYGKPFIVHNLVRTFVFQPIWTAFYALWSKIIIDGSSENSSLDLGNAQRYYLSGPTEFEQVRFKGGETALIAARYYPITFGEGCDTSGILRIYLLGGFNTSVDSRPGSSSITVKSGSFYQIVGFNRMLSGVARYSSPCPFSITVFTRRALTVSLTSLRRMLVKRMGVQT